MTDKQMHSKNLSVELDKSRSTATSLIIDSVDVSGCIVFNNKWGTPLCNPTEDIREAVHCSDYPDCLYKQLKRKEQECKDIREDIKDIANLLDLDTGEEYNFGNIELEIKQLKAKEQECKKAKQNAQDTYELYQALMESFNILQGEKIKLEQEYEELKAELELFKTSNQTTIDQLKAENEDLKKSVLQECPNCGEEYLNYKGAALYFENSDLKQTLAEIKEIAEDTKDKFYDAIHTGGLYDRLEQIIRKINEVEDADSNR